MEKIYKILTENIKWTPNLDSMSVFVSKSYPEKECFLRINDFPEEPLWTLFYKGDSINFDDAPKNWEIIY